LAIRSKDLQSFGNFSLLLGNIRGNPIVPRNPI